MNTTPQFQVFLDKFKSVVDQKQLVKLQLINKRDKTNDLKKIIVSAVELKKGYCLNFVYRHATKDITKNYSIAEGCNHVEQALEEAFFNADLVAVNEQVSLAILPNGKARLHVTSLESDVPVSLSHDRKKERLVEPGENVYLRELGIVNAQGELRREMTDKYKQINKYVELLSPYLNELELPANYHVVDMGSGKGYLTFALYDYLVNKLNHQVSMSGVEFREDMVSICNSIAQKVNFQNLSFKKGTIESTQLEQIDILIALHACNTATDDAIFRGIQANAALIVCAPCCHKQIRKAMNVTNEMSHVMKFGILKERQAELLTDSIRALILEAYGYKTNVFEFISSEHTPKNVMIVGRKMPNANSDKQQILNNIAAIKQLFGIEKHYLETLLGI